MGFKITDIVEIRIGANIIVNINVQFNTAVFGFRPFLDLCLLKIFVLLFYVRFRCLSVECE